MKIIEKKYLSAPETGARFGVSESTVWRWASERPDFPKPLKLGPRTTRWRLPDLEAFEASQGAA